MVNSRDTIPYRSLYYIVKQGGFQAQKPKRGLGGASLRTSGAKAKEKNNNENHEAPT